MFGWCRVHFQKRKCALFQLKNSNKIAEKIWIVLTVGDDVAALFSGSRYTFK
jgi:hypothetical protein